MSHLPSRPRDAAGHFRSVFGASPERVCSAPGRVNLIGEHTDYNGGLCLPMAIGFRADCAVRFTRSGRLRVASTRRPGEVIDLALETLQPQAVSGWAAYVAGAVWATGLKPAGVDIAIDSDIPVGAGLSSSAALECATLGALGMPVGMELAAAAQRAENTFVGMPCGIMDQVASTMSAPGHALLFDARDLTIARVPLELGDLSLLVIDTRAPHQLSDGAYAIRRRECEAAAAQLGVGSLRETTGFAGLPEPLLSRARHVITENARVARVAELLRGGETAAIGPLMTLSHASLRDDFLVTVPELDVAVETSLSAGSLGARMTGAGFGGSIVALTADPRATAEAVEAAFAERGWREPRWFVAEASAGLSALS